MFSRRRWWAQKSFASTFLNHVNPYRGVRYADDPAIAFVEITNENSVFMWNAEESLRALPAYYADVLQNLYNDWLLGRYGTRAALEAAWSQGVDPLGNNMIANGDFQQAGGGGVPLFWVLEQHGSSSGVVAPAQYLAQDCAALQVTNGDGVGWHLQLHEPGLAVEEGAFYTLRFDAAAGGARSLDVAVMQHHDPWQSVGLSRTVSLTTGWQSFEMGFVANSDDANVRVNFAFGAENDTVYLANVELRPGGQQGLLPGEDPSTDSVAVFVNAPGLPRQMDRLRFLAETEQAYFDEMRSYVKNDLACAAPVTGTIVFGPLGLYGQQNMDFVDAHAYWRHPWFPGIPWDGNNWFVEQDAMVDQPGGATLFSLAAERLGNRPFTVSEYNHSAPNDYQVETIPMSASFAAAQDWDAVWIYSYAHSPAIWDDGYFNSYFDIANNPSKFGFMRAGAAIFRDGGLAPLGAERLVDLASSGNALDEASALRLTYGDSVWGAVQGAHGVTWADLLAERARISFGPLGAQVGGVGTTLTWDAGNGLYNAIGDGAWAFVGWTDAFATGTGGLLAVSAPAFAGVTVTALDGRSLEASDQILVTACGTAENTNMLFSPDRRTVNSNWGQAPVQVETVEGTLQLPPGRWICQRLAPDGTAAGAVGTSYVSGVGELVMTSGHGTMWYLLDRARGDADGDGDVDAADGAGLLGCLTGPGIVPAPFCEVYDLQGDYDVDMRDVASFQQNVSP